jgi:hypothetical protein
MGSFVEIKVEKDVPNLWHVLHNAIVGKEGE